MYLIFLLLVLVTHFCFSYLRGPLVFLANSFPNCPNNNYLDSLFIVTCLVHLTVATHRSNHINQVLYGRLFLNASLECHVAWNFWGCNFHEFCGFFLWTKKVCENIMTINLDYWISVKLTETILKHYYKLLYSCNTTNSLWSVGLYFSCPDDIRNHTFRKMW